MWIVNGACHRAVEVTGDAQEKVQPRYTLVASMYTWCTFFELFRKQDKLQRRQRPRALNMFLCTFFTLAEDVHSASVMTSHPQRLESASPKNWASILRPMAHTTRIHTTASKAVYSPLVQVDIGLLAHNVRVAATHTLDLSQGVLDLALAVNVGVEQTRARSDILLPCTRVHTEGCERTAAKGQAARETWLLRSDVTVDKWTTASRRKGPEKCHVLRELFLHVTRDLCGTDNSLSPGGVRAWVARQIYISMGSAIGKIPSFCMDRLYGH